MKFREESHWGAPRCPILRLPAAAELVYLVFEYNTRLG